MLNAINFLRGNVEIIIEGAYPERFLNVCAQNGIAFWGMTRIDKDKISARIKIQGYKRLHSFAKRCMCTISIAKKRGMPFFLRRFRKRYALIIGLIACVTAGFFMNMFIWDIDVVGNENIPKERILQGLSEIGVGIGAYAPSIDPQSIKHQMILKVDGLLWLTVNVSGSRAVVEVRERVEAPEIINENIPCNIVAAKAGVITRMDTLKGAPQSAVGMTVKEGDLLISGIMDSEKVGMRYVHAMGDIYARTWYELGAKMPVDAIGKEYTDREKTRNALVFAGNRINLYFNGGISYKDYDKIMETTELKLPGGRKMPVALVSETYREYEKTALKVKAEAAERLLVSGLEKRLKELISGGEILNKEYKTELKDGILTVSVICECEEQIARAIPVITD